MVSETGPVLHAIVRQPGVGKAPAKAASSDPSGAVLRTPSFNLAPV